VLQGLLEKSASHKILINTLLVLGLSV